MDVVLPEHTATFSSPGPAEQQRRRRRNQHQQQQAKKAEDRSREEEGQDVEYQSDKVTVVQWTTTRADRASVSGSSSSDIGVSSSSGGNSSNMHPPEDRTTVNLISFNPSCEQTPVSASSCAAPPPLPPHTHRHHPDHESHCMIADPAAVRLEERKAVVANNDSTMKKGLLWQMKDGGGFFNRWKERYFILTKDYLTCFKKSSSNLSFLGSEMGSFAYKLKLLEIESITWKSCSDCSTRSRIIPRSMRTIGRRSGSKKSKGCKHKRSQSTDQNHKSSDGEVHAENSGTESSDNTSSTRTMSRKGSSSLKAGVREVISIVLRESGSQIDLWTAGDACLNDWMFVLKEACSHSKGRREALIKKSQTLCAPSPSHQPFALSSYWATARKSQDRVPEKTCQTADVSDMPYLKSYSSLRIGSHFPSSSSLISNSTATNCHQARGGAKLRTAGNGIVGNRRGSSDCKSGNQRSESMINFSKRLSILTGKEVLFPVAPEDRGRDVDVRAADEEEQDDATSISMHSNQSHRRDDPSASSSVIRSRERTGTPPLTRDQSTDGSGVQYRHHEPSDGSPNGGGREARIAPPLRQSSLVSLDRRLITRSGGPATQSNHSHHSHHHPLPPLPPNNNDSVRRSALLRSASGISTTGATFSTLGPNHQYNCLPPGTAGGVGSNSGGGGGSLMNQPVPRSLQVSPALTQRSLYAQHIFSQPEGPSPVFCTASRAPSSKERSSCGTPLSWMKEEILRHGSRGQEGYNNGSSMKSATSEFSFCRPDSPLTLPYNKSKSFYGRPVSTGGIQSSNPSIHASCCTASGIACSATNAGLLPPPRPPLPKQGSQEESSTLFRCSAAATQASRAKAKAAAAAAASAVAAAHNVSLGSTGSAFSASIDSSSGGSTTSSSARSSSLVPESAADFISRPSSCHFDPRSEHTLEDLTTQIQLSDNGSSNSGSGTSSRNAATAAASGRKNRMNRILHTTTKQFSQ